MRAGDQLKDHYHEASLFRFRAMMAALIATLAVFLLLGRLYYLQSINYDHYSTLSQNNRVRLMAVAPTRGLIYDRNGVLIAENLPSYRLEIIPEEVDDMDATLAGLRSFISFDEEDLERFHSTLKRKRPFEGIALLTNLNDEQVARVAANRHRFPGVDIVARLSRNYPLGDLGAHVLGYVGRIDERELQILDAKNYSATRWVGKIGIEKYYEDQLHGAVGFRQVEVNAEGRVLRVLEEEAPQPGQTLYLTIDAELQRVAREALGEFSGAVVAIEPRTGDVLAMISKPEFDPNLFVHGIPSKTYQVLSTHEDRPLFNRALSGQYPPGSIVKPFIGLAGLEHGVKSGNEKIVCRGYFTLPNDERKYRDWKKWGHGIVDLDTAITQSCDVYFYELALQLGIDRISPYLSQFGFGDRTGIDNIGEATGILPSRAWKRRVRHQPWFPGETLITGIGQGYMTATPLQLASATATLANAGRRLKPRLFLGHERVPESDRTPETLSQVEIKHESNWSYVLHAMRNVTQALQGTAYRASLEAAYKSAGKTGTAQVVGIAQDEEYDQEKLAFKLRDHALYIAFAPIDDPKIAIAVIVEHGGSGGSVAAPVARKVMDYYLVDSVKKKVPGADQDEG